MCKKDIKKEFLDDIILSDDEAGLIKQYLANRTKENKTLSPNIRSYNQTPFTHNLITDFDVILKDTLHHKICMCYENILDVNRYNNINIIEHYCANCKKIHYIDTNKFLYTRNKNKLDNIILCDECISNKMDIDKNMLVHEYIYLTQLIQKRASVGMLDMYIG